MTPAGNELLTKLILRTAEEKDFSDFSTDFSILAVFLDSENSADILGQFGITADRDQYEREDDKGNFFWQEMLEIREANIPGQWGILFRIFRGDPPEYDGYEVSTGDDWK